MALHSLWHLVSVLPPFAFLTLHPPFGTKTAKGLRGDRLSREGVARLFAEELSRSYPAQMIRTRSARKASPVPLFHREEDTVPRRGACPFR